MDNSRNLILAFILSGLVLIGWTSLSERYFPTPKPVPAGGQVAATGASGTQAGGAPVASAPQTPGTPPATALRDIATVRKQSPRIIIETPKLSGSINLVGAQIDDLVMTTYKETIEKNSPPVRLFSPFGTPTAYFSGFGWAGEGLELPGPQSRWQADANRLTPQTPVTLRWSNGSGQTFTIRIAVDSNYLFTVEQSVSNAGSGPVAIRPYAFVTRRGESKDVDTWVNHVGPIGAFNDSVNYDVDWSTLTEAGAKGEYFTSKGGWLGFGDLHWLTAVVPAQSVAVDAGFRAANGMFQAEFSLPQTIVAPGKQISTSARLFAGAKEVRLLDDYQEKQAIPLFGKAIDWGWFEVFAKPFFYLLDNLFKLVGNFGVAIMLLTLIVRGVMFPVAQRQFASMAAMRVLQPKMKALQERYKDDKVKLQQEMIELYKKEKVSPFSGCLPIFIQIPVFYALYKVLLVAIEMRHQPFILWIKDLSAPDPSHILNLFGLLDFTVPSFLGIGVLAILLGITMYLQFKLNPAQLDPVQQQVFAIMPWLMMFIMAPFAAGLLVYWITNNVLTIAQQKWLYSRHPGMAEPVKV